MFRLLILLFIILITPEIVFSQEYYSSNKLGMELSSIKKIRIDEFEYYLEKTTEGGAVKKILYHNSVPVLESEIYYAPDGSIDKEVIREDGTLTEKKYMTSHLYQEKIINSDKTGVIRKYKYDSLDQLYSVEEFSLEGTAKSTVSYERDSRGRIVSVNRVLYNKKPGSNSDEQVSKYRFSGQNLLEEWHGSGNLTGSFIYYNSEGRVSAIIEKNNDRVVSDKKYFYNDDKSAVVEELIPETGEKIISTLNPDGTMIEELIYVKDTLAVKTTDTYEEKKLVKRIVVNDKGTERYLYQYRGDKVTIEAMYFNGELVYQKVYDEDDSWYEDIYDNGKRYLRNYYKNSEKIKTEKW